MPAVSITVARATPVAVSVTRAAPVTVAAAVTGATGPGVAPGGTPGQVLVKTGAGEYATGWRDEVPLQVPSLMGVI